MKFYKELYTAREESFEIESPEVFITSISSAVTITESHNGSKLRRARFINFLKREGKKVNSPIQLLIFIKKLIAVLLLKVLKR